MSPERSSGSPAQEAPKMSAPASPIAGTPVREAQSPISLLLAVAQSQSVRNGDDDLTSLSWLQDKDLLKGINLVNPSPCNSVQTTPIKFYTSAGAGMLSDQSPTSDFVDDSSISAADSSGSSLNSPIPHLHHNAAGNNNNNNNNGNSGGNNQRHRHPHNIPYDPLVHTSNKPPYSFSCLIFMAIEDSEQKALPVKEIYAWIVEHFPYFRNAPTGWKNSVRHNLSLNKCFQKVEKAPNLGKGSLWTVDQQYRPNLLQALTRSPFHPCSSLDLTLSLNNNNNNNNHNNNNNNNEGGKLQPAPDKSSTAGLTRLLNPELFPYLSRTLAATEVHGKHRAIKLEASDSESLDAVDAATVMLSLKNGPRYRQKSRPDKGNGVWQVITTSPSQDHTYSAAGSVSSSGMATDEAFESDEERVPRKSTCRKIDFEDEEERKIKEGAETLLNLAGISTCGAAANSRKRSASSSSPFNLHISGGGAADSFKRIRLGRHYSNEEEAEGGRASPVAQFRPRLLRTKKKAAAAAAAKSNNNNENDEWTKHRRELDKIQQQRR